MLNHSQTALQSLGGKSGLSIASVSGMIAKSREEQQLQHQLFSRQPGQKSSGGMEQGGAGSIPWWGSTDSCCTLKEEVWALTYPGIY